MAPAALVQPPLSLRPSSLPSLLVVALHQAVAQAHPPVTRLTVLAHLPPLAQATTHPDPPPLLDSRAQLDSAPIPNLPATARLPLPDLRPRLQATQVSPQAHPMLRLHPPLPHQQATPLHQRARPAHPQVPPRRLQATQVSQPALRHQRTPLR